MQLTNFSRRERQQAATDLKAMGEAALRASEMVLEPSRDVELALELIMINIPANRVMNNLTEVFAEDLEIRREAQDIPDTYPGE
jgi:hypothetical protein